MTEDTASTEGEITWTLGEMPVQVVEDDPVEDEAEGAMTPVLVGIGLFIAVAAGVGGVLYLRSRGDLDFDDDDDDDEKIISNKPWLPPPPPLVPRASTLVRPNRWTNSRVQGNHSTRTHQKDWRHPPR